MKPATVLAAVDPVRDAGLDLDLDAGYWLARPAP